MTIKDIQMYRFLDHAITLAIRDVNALAGSNSLRDSVTGSNPDYPYEERNFSVVGQDMAAEAERKQKLRSAEAELARLKILKARIEEMSRNLTDARDRIILENTMRGKTQVYIATLIGIDQSTVSRRLETICRSETEENGKNL